MSHLLDFLNAMYTYLFGLFGIDFTGYTGNLPSELIQMYTYVDKFFQILCIFYLLYLIFNFVVFLISLGGVRKWVRFGWLS